MALMIRLLCLCLLAVVASAVEIKPIKPKPPLSFLAPGPPGSINKKVVDDDCYKFVTSSPEACAQELLLELVFRDNFISDYCCRYFEFIPKSTCPAVDRICKYVHDRLPSAAGASKPETPHPDFASIKEEQSNCSRSVTEAPTPCAQELVHHILTGSGYITDYCCKAFRELGEQTCLTVNGICSFTQD